MLCNFLRCVLLKLAQGARSSVYPDVGRACVGCSLPVAVPPLPSAGTRPEPAEPAGPPAPRGHPTGMAGTDPPWSWGSRGQEQGQLLGCNPAMEKTRQPLLPGTLWLCRAGAGIKISARIFTYSGVQPPSSSLTH